MKYNQAIIKLAERSGAPSSTVRFFEHQRVSISGLSTSADFCVDWQTNPWQELPEIHWHGYHRDHLMGISYVEIWKKDGSLIFSGGIGLHHSLPYEKNGETIFLLDPLS